MNKKMDRMPKEYKIAVYAIILGIAYFFLYSLIFYGKFYYKPFFAASIAIVLVYIILLVFLIRKSNISRILLAVVSLIQSALFLLAMFSLVFFKQSIVLFSKVTHKTAFTFYLLLGQLGTTPDKGIFASLIVSVWGLFVAYLLLNRETARFTKEKTYDLVDTSRETSIVILILFAAIAILYFLVRF